MHLKGLFIFPIHPKRKLLTSRGPAYYSFWQLMLSICHHAQCTHVGNEAGSHHCLGGTFRDYILLRFLCLNPSVTKFRLAPPRLLARWHMSTVHLHELG